MASNLIADMYILFASIPLSRIPASITMNGAVLLVLALFIVAAEQQGGAGPAHRGHSRRQHHKLMIRNTSIHRPASSRRGR
ncbi:methylmalonyl-CoA mutase family protein [Nonomuraea fuscirosea]|uniref:methylmalonyl-CoA mutase family protein n=1 Tax=Nonomuraea fuscirosea TaxID=1291556 RepID=UPI0033FE1A70